MKRLISSGLGAAPVLALFTLAAIHTSSCGRRSATGSPNLAGATSHQPILIAADGASSDSSGTVGNGTGNHPLVTLTCINLECPLMQLNSYTPVSVGTDSVDYVIEAKTTGAIPANTTLQLVVRLKKEAVNVRAADAMKK